MSLAQELLAVQNHVATVAPAPVLAAMDAATDKLRQGGLEAAALQVGQRITHFELPNAVGGQVSSKALLANGPLLVTFYRGEWCPYCNLALKALGDALPQIQAAGAQLVAISPQTPDHSLSMQKKHELAYPVLSDSSNRVAAQFGLSFVLDESLKPIYQAFNIDLPATNGDASFTLPVPATYLVGRDGVVLERFLDVDYRTRLEPSDAIAWIKKHTARV
jgi:peroxiredoxin